MRQENKPVEPKHQPHDPLKTTRNPVENDAHKNTDSKEDDAVESTPAK